MAANGQACACLSFCLQSMVLYPYSAPQHCSQLTLNLTELHPRRFISLFILKVFVVKNSSALPCCFLLNFCLKSFFIQYILILFFPSPTSSQILAHLSTQLHGLSFFSSPCLKIKGMYKYIKQIKNNTRKATP